MRRRALPFTIAVVLAAPPVLVSCGDNGTTTDESGRLSVAAAFYPLAELVSAVGGDAVEVTTIVPPGEEAHVRVHAQRRARHILHVARPPESHRINHALDASLPGRSHVNDDATHFVMRGAGHWRKHRIVAGHIALLLKKHRCAYWRKRSTIVHDHTLEPVCVVSVHTASNRPPTCPTLGDAARKFRKSIRHVALDEIEPA